MEFEKLYMFNPFTIQNADSKQISDTYTKLQNELKDNSDTGFRDIKKHRNICKYELFDRGNDSKNTTGI